MSTLSELLRCTNCGYSFSNRNPTKSLISPVPSLLGSNTTPTSTEVPGIRRALREAEGKLLVLDNEIDLLETFLEQRQQERQALVDFRYAHAALLSPIHRLPPELLSEIFLSLSTPHTEEAWHSTFIVGAVCKHWRNVALSTPRLWCTIYVNLEQQDSDSIADMVRIWVERSAHCPLSVILQAEDDYGANIDPVIDIIINHSHRLQFFSVAAGATTWHALSSLQGQLPMLQTLILDAPDGFDEESPCDIFVDAPNLRTLDCSCSPNILDLPFSQIIRYSTRYFDTHECVEVLRVAPNVRVCEFRETGSSYDVTPVHPPVVSSLHSLSFEDFDGDLVIFFTSLTLPAIRELSIDFSASHKLLHWPHAEFNSLVSRSSCQLEKLVLRHICIPSEDTMRCLKAIPLLQELEIGGADCVHRRNCSLVNDAVLQKLTHLTGSSAQQPLVPLLHTVCFSGHLTFKDHSLLKMVESRLRGILPEGLRRLRSVRVDLGRDFEPQIKARARAWREQGLDILLTSYY